MLPSAPFLLRAPPKIIPAGASFDAATTLWINAVVADGGAVSATQKTRVDALIVGLKADSLWTITDRIWIYAGESDTHQAKIDLKALSSHSLVGTPTFAVDGYTGDGGVGTSSNYINTNFDISSATNFTDSDASSLCYVMNSRTSDQFWFSFGAKHGGSGNELIMNSFRTSSLSNFTINNNVDGAVATANAQGLWVMSRVTATANEAKTYRNGNSTPIFTDSSSQSFNRANLSGIPIYSCARNDSNPSPGSTFGSGDRVGVLAFAAGLTATQASNYASRVNTYMTAWGINVY